MWGSARRSAARDPVAVAALLVALPVLVAAKGPAVPPTDADGPAAAGGDAAAEPAPTAEPAPEPTADQPIVFVLPLDVDATAADAALRTIRAHTVDVGAPFVIERIPTMPAGNRQQIRQAMELARRHGARGVFWLDLAADDDILLYLHEPEGVDTLMRRLPRSEASDAATLESLGLVVSSISTALVAGGEIGMTVVEVDVEPEEPEPPPPAPSVRRTRPEPPRKKRPWPLVRLTAAYVGNSFGKELVWQHGLHLALDFRPVRRMVIGASYDVMFPSTVKHELVEVELRRHPIGIHGGFRGDPHRMIGLEALAGVALDVLKRSSNGIEVMATRGKRFFVPSAGARGRLVFVPMPGLELHVDAGFDVVINNVRYVVSDEEGMNAVTILDPHRVRARVGAGMSYAFP